MSEEDKLKTNNEKVIINDYYYYYLLKCEDALNELENIRKEAIRYIQNNQLYNFDYDKEELFEIVSDKVAKEYLLYILNKGDKNE